MSLMTMLDDRAEQRATTVRIIRTVLPEGWDCTECPLLENRADYPDWLIRHNIDVLLVDQVLGDEAPPGLPAVDYKGHEVVESIRGVLPNFPTYIFTAQRDEDLPAHEGEVEDVIERQQFIHDPEKFVFRMIRAGQRFHEEHERQLREMTTLATKVASGTATEDEKNQLKNLQISLGTPTAAAVNVSREDALGDAENKADALEELITHIDRLLREAKK